MKRTKSIGLAAVLALTAAALLAAAPAGATTTALCKVHQTPCAAGNLVTKLHMVATTPKFLVEAAGIPSVIICSQSLLEGKVGALGAPQLIVETTLNWSNCEIGEQQLCTVATTKLGKLEVLRTALNLATVQAVGHEILLSCLQSGIKCVYASPFTLAMEGAKHTAGAGHGMATAAKFALDPCFNTKFDVLYEATEDFYVVE